MQHSLASMPVQYDARMGNDARSLLTEALALHDSDRSDPAAALLASLDESTSDSQEDVEPLWAAEIQRRANRVLSGDSHGEPWDEVRSRIERDLAAG